MDEFFTKLQLISPECLMNIIKGNKLPKENVLWELHNEIKPIDLYCYLFAIYGNPNGIQNYLRGNHSDNLIHWEWAFATELGLIIIHGMNFRTEIHLIGDFKGKFLITDFINQIQIDSEKNKANILKVKKELEKWHQFVNPFYRIYSSIEQNLSKINSLNIDPIKDKLSQPKTNEEFTEFKIKWDQLTDKYNFAIGLAFGIRAMLPVLAESFINIILFLLARPEIKQNKRLFESTIRQQIDIRIQTLHINCVGFKHPIDYSSDPCKNLNKLINERNDLRHGNIDIDKLTFNEVYFRETVPIFVEYEDFWDKSIGVSLNSIRFSKINSDYETIKSFIEYLLSNIDETLRDELELILYKRELGFNKNTKRVGILFADHFIDFRASKGSDHEN